uniref:Uncharacterized protein n=1 Tax=Arundo donax TaxID=35708 RepID=A0A0A8Z7I3_ARUDO
MDIGMYNLCTAYLPGLGMISMRRSLLTQN